MSDVPDSSIDNRDGSEQDSSRQSDLGSSNPSDRNNINIDDDDGPGGDVAGNAAGAEGDQQRRAAPQDGGVPQYVDMVIPQYESSSGERGQRQNSSGRSPMGNAETSSDSNGDTGQDSGTSQEENDSAENDQQSEDSDELRMGERIPNPAEADVLLTEGDEHPGNKKYQGKLNAGAIYSRRKEALRRRLVQRKTELLTDIFPSLIL